MSKFNSMMLALALGLLWSGTAHAGLLGDMKELRAAAVPMLGAAGMVVGGCFWIVSRVTKKKQAEVIAKYEEHLNKFRRSIRGGVRH